jgi:hypothetical protein
MSLACSACRSAHSLVPGRRACGPVPSRPARRGEARRGHRSAFAARSTQQQCTVRQPTCCPGYQLVPLCLTRISPAFTYCSPNRFTPRRRPALLRLFFVDPPPRFVAVRIWMAPAASSTDADVRPASGDSADEVDAEAEAEAAKREKSVSIARAWWSCWSKGETGAFPRRRQRQEYRAAAQTSTIEQ